MALAIVSLMKRGSIGVAEAIRDLLDCLPIPQDTFSPIRPTSQEPSISKLPDSILVSEIFSRLSTTQEVARARCVSRRWRGLLSSSSFGQVWHKKRECRELWMVWGGKGERYGYARVEEEAGRGKQYNCKSCKETKGGEGLGNWMVQVKRCERWPKIEDMNPVATSHGLVCVSSSSWFNYYDDNYSKGPTIFVGNPRTSTWKQLPDLPSFPPFRSTAQRFSVRFISHHLLHHTYSIFFQIFNPFDLSHHYTFLYDSSSESTPHWTPLHRLPIPLHRLRSAIVDSSVAVIDYHVVTDSQTTDDHRAKITIFDFHSNTWDEVDLDVHHSIATHGTRTHNFIRFVSLSPRCKDQYCRLISIDENTSISLWELDVETDGAMFRHVSSSGTNASPASARNAEESSEEFIRELFYGAPQARAYIIRSDEEVFMAMMTLGGSSKQFLLVSYDVVRSIWYLNIRKDVRGCTRSTSFLPPSKRERFLWSLLSPNPHQHSYIQDVIPDPSLWSSP